ncbi:MAG TPA: hypothetical protein VMC78_09850 [Mycobacterium sp.]|nr:hypothetical protein [Mycobacterium sp.]
MWGHSLICSTSSMPTTASRAKQLTAVTRILDRRGISAETCPPIVALLAITGISQILVPLPHSAPDSPEVFC